MRPAMDERLLLREEFFLIKYSFYNKSPENEQKFP
jgi:hypothetical protein